VSDLRLLGDLEGAIELNAKVLTVDGSLECTSSSRAARRPEPAHGFGGAVATAKCPSRAAV
jgi:hypothetical protein